MQVSTSGNAATEATGFIELCNVGNVYGYCSTGNSDSNMTLDLKLYALFRVYYTHNNIYIHDIGLCNDTTDDDHGG